MHSQRAFGIITAGAMLGTEELPIAGAMGVALNGVPIYPASDNHNALLCE